MKKLVLLAAILLAPTAQARRAAPAPVGVVSAADPRAAAAGVEILKAGGSATDAAIATMLALNVVEPQSSGIGGGSFWVTHSATGGLRTIDARETAPAAATDRWFYGPDGKPLSHFDAVPGGRSVGVPGALRGMALAHRQGGRLPWARLFAPAIRLARDGWVASPRFASGLATYGGHITPATRALFAGPGGRALQGGDRLTNPAQAALLERIARLGPDSFYVGPQATKLVQAVNTAARNPSRMTAGDLASYAAKPRPPVCVAYRAYASAAWGRRRQVASP